MKNSWKKFTIYSNRLWIVNRNSQSIQIYFQGIFTILMYTNYCDCNFDEDIKSILEKKNQLNWSFCDLMFRMIIQWIEYWYISINDLFSMTLISLLGIEENNITVNSTKLWTLLSKAIWIDIEMHLNNICMDGNTVYQQFIYLSVVIQIIYDIEY